jgi:hypothetical protein
VVDEQAVQEHDRRAATFLQHAQSHAPGGDVAVLEGRHARSVLIPARSRGGAFRVAGAGSHESASVPAAESDFGSSE